MAYALPDDLRRAIDEGQGSPVEVVHPESKEQFVLIRAEVYERLRSLLDLGAQSADEKKHMLQQIGKSVGWEEPSADNLL